MSEPGLKFDRMQAVDGQKEEIHTRFLAKRLPRVDRTLPFLRTWALNLGFYEFRGAGRNKWTFVCLLQHDYRRRSNENMVYGKELALCDEATSL